MLCFLHFIVAVPITAHGLFAWSVYFTKQGGGCFVVLGVKYTGLGEYG